MAMCLKCGFEYPDYGNGCWRCDPSLALEYRDRFKNKSKNQEIYCGELERPRRDDEEIDGTVYLSDGIYINAEDAWW